MEPLTKKSDAEGPAVAACEVRTLDLEAIPREPTAQDQALYEEITSTELSPEQVAAIAEPEEIHARQRSVLGVHWHPEWIPMDLIMGRIANMFPSRESQLIIPTQHNQLLSLDGYDGVEVDCYSGGFKRKVQLLVHFRTGKVPQDSIFLDMLAHTFKYRQSQLFEFLDSLIDEPWDDRRQEAAEETGANQELVEFVAIHAANLRRLIADNEAETLEVMVKNKLVRDYLDGLRGRWSDRLINRAQLYVQQVKKIVKRHFSLEYFYRASEIIEEVRSLGGGVIIPHPEQFWPILLADYDVDGIEVWNPQSMEYTDFLISTVFRRNKGGCAGERRVLVVMGDDTHMSEKAKPVHLQNREKASREVGVQPAWDDLAIRKALIVAGQNRQRVIEEYKARLG